MLNWAARYLPILRVLSRSIGDGDSVLEIGSGSFGLVHFYLRPLVGCDIRFPSPPEKPMKPVVCSATQLPFLDRSFEAVVASDMLEHVPPSQRRPVIYEALRVARKLAVFAFPDGFQARATDEMLFNEFRSAGIPVPDWLEEHLQYPYPDRHLFHALPPQWNVSSFGNEHAGFHRWMVHKEMNPRSDRAFRLLLRLLPRAVEWALRAADRPPYYRRVYVATRTICKQG